MHPNIQQHPSWDILDATKLQSYMDCPRMYFYEYILGWRPETPNIHLEFGSAWHLAMETLLLRGYTAEAIVEAMVRFNGHYRQHFPELMDDANHPKTPAMAYSALVNYCKEYVGEQFETLYTEIAGTVALTENRRLHFKMDSVLRTPEGIKSREHKTGSQLSRQWTDQWALKMQTGVYNHVLYCLFPRNEVWGVEINGVIFNKTKVQFSRVPARRSIEAMEAWYENTKAWVSELDQDMERLDATTEGQVVMPCFKQNTESCTKYFGCKFHDFCLAWANPLDHADSIPYGMKQEWWNPAEEEKDAKHIFRVSEDGVAIETKEQTV